MLPVSLSCKINAYSADLGRDVFERSIELCAGKNVQLQRVSNFQAWYETSLMTFGSAAWYDDVSSLTLRSLLAVGIAGRRAGTRESYVATVSAFSAVSANLSATLGRILGRVSQREVSPRTVRAKLGRFVDKSVKRHQLSSLEILSDTGNRQVFYRDAGSFLSWPGGINSLELELEDKTPTSPSAAWREAAGLTAVGLELSEERNVMVNRDLSIELLDVTADMTRVVGTLSELIEILEPYLEIES